MPKVLLAHESDSEGYTHLILDGPVGGKQAGEVVEVELVGDQRATLILHGQTSLDVSSEALSVSFPDGTNWRALDS